MQGEGLEFLHCNIQRNVFNVCTMQFIAQCIFELLCFSILIPPENDLFGCVGGGFTTISIFVYVYLTLPTRLSIPNFPVWSKFTFDRRNDICYIHGTEISHDLRCAMPKVKSSSTVKTAFMPQRLLECFSPFQKALIYNVILYLLILTVLIKGDKFMRCIF